MTAHCQWNIKVKIQELDRGGMQVKNMWSKGETITVQIEPHATFGQLKQKVSYLVSAHEKWQTLKLGDVELDNMSRIDAVEGLGDGGTVDLYAKAPAVEEEDIGTLSDDPDAMEEEGDELPPLPDDASMAKELTDDEMDNQNKFKGEAAEMLEDGDKKGALDKLTSAVMVGAPNAMLLCKRGELLLKLRRPKAALQDSNAALKINPDSAKAYRLRGKVNRYLSLWEQAVEDFAQCQKIDYDDDIADIHKFCTRRKVWHAKAAMKAKKKEEAAS
mmetsp:Transcript_37638/g.86919  ORF Transcript_37638/g.86919 Transcript_37638/m.86919 type:complete len:273 (-) Transcript_37638:210-1028(-)